MKTQPRTWLRCMPALLLAIYPTHACLADDFYWTGNCGGEWQTTCSGAMCSETLHYIYNNWSDGLCGNVPPSPGMDDTVHISSGYAYIFSTSIFAGQVDLGPDATIFVDAFANQNRALELFGPAQHNDGSILINAPDGGGRCFLRIRGNMVISGNGEIVLGKNHVHELANLDTESGMTLTNGPEHTVRGRGHIHGAINNEGLIEADIPGDILHLLENDKSNSGTISACNGSQLYIESISISQTPSGRLLANSGTVSLRGNVLVDGGNLASADSGLITAWLGGNALRDVTIAPGGAFIIKSAGNDGVVELLGGCTTNNGTLQISSSDETGRSTLLVTEDVTVTGTGSILLDKYHHYELANLDTADGVTLTNAADHTIHGRGHIHANINNEGLMVADMTGSVLSVLACRTNNSGTVGACNNAELHLTGHEIVQTPEGQVMADGGTVALYGNASITGGKLATSNSGLITAWLAGNGLRDVTVQPHSDFILKSGGNDAIVEVAGTYLVNDGTLHVSSSSETGRCTLRVTENVTISGAGDLLLDKYHRFELANLDTAEGVMLTNAAGHTIHGRGHIHAAMTNEGCLAVDTPGYTIDVLPVEKGIVNRGTVRVVDGGVLNIKSAVLFTQTAGVAEIDGTLNLNGGPLALAGGTLSGVGTVNGGVSNTGGNVAPGSRVGSMHIGTGYTQGASGRLTIELADAASESYDRLAITGPAVLDGELRLIPIPGHPPAVGETYTVVTAGSIAGVFAAVGGPGTFDVAYNAQNVTVTVATTPGDFDQDGEIDLGDFASFPECMSGPGEGAAFSPPTSACRTAFDLDWDGDVDLTDFGLLQPMLAP